MAFIHRDTFQIYNRCRIGDNDLEDIESFFEVDDLIAPIISKLNIKGYTTANCCQGHPYTMFDDDLFALEPGETIQDKVNGEIYHTIPVSVREYYVFYRVTPQPRSYIMFEEGVQLPSIPDGWKLDTDFGHYTIEKVYDTTSPFNFFTSLVVAMQNLLNFVDKLPVCTNSTDYRWNEYVSSLSKALPNMNNVEIELAREFYLSGMKADEALHKLVKFKGETD